MKTKHLLTAIALPALFAACTAEDVTTAENIVKSDLDNRPVVGEMTFSFGDAQSRATVENYNSITFEEGDKLGVALIDEVASAGATDPINRYNLVSNNSINTNYIFTCDAYGAFSSEAAMVEGNYVFYYPYSTQRTRGQILTNLPKTQALTKMADGKYTSYPSVLAYSEEKGAPIAVAYDFLSASDAGNTLQGTLKQIYTTPLFTLENTAVKGGDGEDKDTPVSITIKQIILSKANSGTFVTSAPLNFADGNVTAYTEADGTAASIVSALFNETISASQAAAGTKKGPWENSILNRKTNVLLGSAVSGGTSSSITLTLEKPVTVPAKGTFSFYAVLPADDYSTDNLVATVYNGEGKSQIVPFNSVVLTAGQRYPEGEFDANEKINNDVKGVSLSSMVNEEFELSGQLISTVDELISAIRSAEEDADLTFRMTGSAVINSRVANLMALASSTKALSIEFLNEVAFDGPSITWKSAHNVTFSGDVTINAGATVDMKDANSTFGKIINNGTLNYYAGAINTITNNSTLNLMGNLNTTATIANNSTVVAKANGDYKSITTGALSNGNHTTKVAATLTVNAGVTLNAVVANEENSTLNNEGTISTVANHGTVNNGSADNVNAVITTVTENTAATNYTAIINNYGQMTVTNNAHTINMLDVNAVVTVNGGAGTINNDELAFVTNNASNKVTYTMSGSLKNTDIDAETLTDNSITDLILTGVTLKVNDNIDFDNLNLVISGNVTINSGKGANANLQLQNVASVQILANSKLTINTGVDFATAITPIKGTNASYVNNNN